MLDSALLGAPVLDHRRLDLRAAERVRYLLEQSFRYEYDAPVRQLSHRLVIVPPARHGSQRRLAHRLEITGARASRRLRRDAHGNVVALLQAEEACRTSSSSSWLPWSSGSAGRGRRASSRPCTARDCCGRPG